jgi:hypothetical protein
MADQLHPLRRIAHAADIGHRLNIGGHDAIHIPAGLLWAAGFPAAGRCRHLRFLPF